jgi:fermentation-respiration switch protein FrsA (DUF1100 family)
VRRALVGLGVVVCVVALVTGLFWAFQRRLIYLPQGAPGAAPAAAQEVVLDTADGLRLDGWFLPGPAEGPAVLVANGNGGHRGLRAPLAEALNDAGMSVLLFDYRGYAGNPGSPSEHGLVADARAAARALGERPEVDPTRIAYFGESLGAAVCGALATELPPAALVLRSPFPSVEAIGRHHYPYLPIVEPLIWDRWPLERLLAQRVRVPLLVLVGGRDEIVPPGLSRRVYDAAAEPKRFIEIAATHQNDEALLAGDELLDETLVFLGEWLR